MHTSPKSIIAPLFLSLPPGKVNDEKKQFKTMQIKIVCVNLVYLFSNVLVVQTYSDN